MPEHAKHRTPKCTTCGAIDAPCYKSKRRCKSCDDSIRRLQRYQLTREDLENLMMKQKSRCAICGDRLDRPMVDHDHTTGKVRGLLCLHCNLLLGFSRDNPENLKRAMAYLKKVERKNS